MEQLKADRELWPPEGPVDGGIVMLSEPLYVATTESYGGETLFVLVPLDAAVSGEVSETDGKE